MMFSSRVVETQSTDLLWVSMVPPGRIELPTSALPSVAHMRAHAARSRQLLQRLELGQDLDLRGPRFCPLSAR
jgi:hypothetical protein